MHYHNTLTFYSNTYSLSIAILFTESLFFFVFLFNNAVAHLHLDDLEKVKGLDSF